MQNFKQRWDLQYKIIDALDGKSQELRLKKRNVTVDISVEASGNISTSPPLDGLRVTVFLRPEEWRNYDLSAFRRTLCCSVVIPQDAFMRMHITVGEEVGEKASPLIFIPILYVHPGWFKLRSKTRNAYRHLHRALINLIVEEGYDLGIERVAFRHYDEISRLAKGKLSSAFLKYFYGRPGDNFLPEPRLVKISYARKPQKITTHEIPCWVSEKSASPISGKGVEALKKELMLHMMEWHDLHNLIDSFLSDLYYRYGEDNINLDKIHVLKEEYYEKILEAKDFINGIKGKSIELFLKP
jgi:hypothetical protein